MPIRNYTVPGTEATIVDYQIAPAPITNPGDIVILLGDLPDSITMSDPLNPGSNISMDIPINQPLIINQETQLGAISSTEFRNALTSLGDTERSLEMINVLPILNSSLPLALCKITKRNGERPEAGNTKDYYEALEFAYEHLSNYPAGRIVPMHISIEDSVLMDQLSNLGVEVYDSIVSSTAESKDYGNNIITVNNPEVTFSIDDLERIDTFSYTVEPDFDPAFGQGIARFRFYLGANNGGNYFQENLIQLKYDGVNNWNCLQPADLYANPTADTIDEYLHDLGGYMKAYEKIQELVNADPTANSILIATNNAEFKFMKTPEFVSNISNVRTFENYVILDHAHFPRTGTNLQSVTQDITIVMEDGQESIGTFNCSININPMQFGVVATDLSTDYEEENFTNDGLIFINPLPIEIDVETWFSGGTLMASDFKFQYEDVITDPGNPTIEIVPLTGDMSTTNMEVRPAKIDYEPAYRNFVTTTRIDNSYDRSFNTVYKFTENDGYDDSIVGITIDKDKSFATKSMSLKIDKFTPSIEFQQDVVIGGRLRIGNVEYETPTISVLPISSGSQGFVVQEDYDLNVDDIVTLTLRKGLILPPDPISAVAESIFEYEVSIVPLNADFSNRGVQFCEEMTAQLNDCTMVMGTIPPATISSEDIEEQVERLRLNLSNKTYVGATADNGLYLTVTSGSQKVSNIGGITNFPSARVTSFNPGSELGGTKATVSFLGSLEFKVGDKIDLEITRRGRIYVVENVVESVIKTTTGYEVTLKNTLEGTLFGNVNLNSSRSVSLTNLKDSKGTYLAALYAVESNNYGIDKAPFNYTMPGDGEIFYSRNQIERLLDTNLTPISRNAFNTSATVIDTPTMAQDSSDFTDQGTVGLIMYFIRELRAIAAPRKGQRFGSGARQIAFQTELEAPFEAQVGETILAYNLVPDWTALQTDETLNIEFSIREAKKLKVVKITAKLF